MWWINRLVPAIVVIGVSTSAVFGIDQPGIERFEKHVRPILAERCVKCHGADVQKGGLRLDSAAAFARGGESGPAATPGNPRESLIIEAVSRAGDLKMPPKESEKLSAAQVSALADWIRDGAIWPEDARIRGGSVATEGSLWALRSLSDPAPPAVRETGRVESPIDRFLLAGLQAKGLRLAPPADRRTLLRRLTFDLTGLPPTPDEADAFLLDESPDAYERLADRLLASRAYGERWGRRWLDVVRYADTSGCNGDFPVPDAYRYRNYVIDSFNQDVPYDRFLREQLAGDLLPASNDAERFRQIIATGYLAISRRFSSVAEEYHLTLDDTVENFGKAILGLSIACARCHDHKFDPITKRDYYAIYGIFESTELGFPGTEIYRHTENMTPLVSSKRLESEIRPYLDRIREIDAEIHTVYDKIARLDLGKEKNAAKARWETLKKRRDALVKAMPPHERAFAAFDGRPTDSRIHVKGDPNHLSDVVPRGFPAVLGGHVLPPDERGSGRKQLAAWVTDPANPLTYRVIVNRIWQGHFGKGLVRTPSDFGSRGEAPSHPELLDWLTRRFVDDGFSVKAAHRRVVLSAAYRSASVEDDEAFRIDPENRLLWTFPRRRLDAEEIRDAVLAVSGALDRSPGGRHPFPPEWEWRYSQHNPFVNDYATDRRSVYLMQQRIRKQPFLDTFDGPDSNALTDARASSAAPQQSLFLMNNVFIHERSDAFARRLATEAESTTARLDRAFRLALARSPTEQEHREASEYLDKLALRVKSAGVAESKRTIAAWSSFLRVMLCSNEFVFID